MRRLLRSVIDFGDGKLTPEALHANMLRLADKATVRQELDWVQPVDVKIYHVVKEFFTNTLGTPSIETVTDFFTRSSDVEATERLGDIRSAPVYAHANYGHLLDQIVEDQKRQKMQILLKDASEIVSKGLETGKGIEKRKLRGISDALSYIAEKSYDLLPHGQATRTRGDFREEDAAARYNAKTRETRYGVFFGMHRIDDHNRGIRKGQLWIHAGFVGELKSTIALNWAYTQMTRYRKNVLYVSLEMTREELHDRLVCIHSANPKFKRPGIAYRDIKNGDLSQDDQLFLRQVSYDWQNNPEHCRFRYLVPDGEATTVRDIRMEAELLHKEMELGIVYIDHGGILTPTVPNKDFGVALNSVMRDVKKFAMHFNGGEGIPVVMLFQLNRQGKDRASKAAGRYDLSALSYAHEAERSADYVTTTYLDDDHRANGTTLFCNLKNRHNALMAPLLLRTDLRTGRIWDDGMDRENGQGIGCAEDVLGDL